MPFNLRSLRFPSQTHNLKTFRSSPVSELSGSLGDLGTLLPLLIALTLTHSTSLSSTLVFTGLANVLTGILYGIPLPVQPMKAIAAVAVAQSFSIEETASWAGRVVPIPIVKGIQVGAGLSLVISAGATLLQPLHWTVPWGDNLIWAIVAFVFLLATNASSRAGLLLIPYALLILIIGLVIAAITLSVPSSLASNGSVLQLWHPHEVHINWEDFRTGALTAGLGQLPLTTLNSIIAVTHLSAELLPFQPAPSTTSLGISVAVMNLVGCCFGSMPACHGSGGLAGQYKFGARSGASVVLLGIVKMALGLFIGEDWLTNLLGKFPKSLLGIMVIAAGVELAKVGEGLNSGARDLWVPDEADGLGQGQKPRELNDAEKAERWLVMTTTVAGLLAFKNDAVGFIAGLLCHWGLQAPKAYRKWKLKCSRPGSSVSSFEPSSRHSSENVGLLQGSRE